MTETAIAIDEFKSFSKIPRLSRDVIITEKIDGTNAQIVIPEDAALPLRAGSRTRWISAVPAKADNFGFAAWVAANEAELRHLGPGRHFGEWFGLGIQRDYGLRDRRFALFNVSRWHDPKREIDGRIEGSKPCPPCCTTVPLLHVSGFDTAVIEHVLTTLAIHGSQVVPHYGRPEGIVILHTASGQLFKKTIEDDEKPKEARNA